MFVLKAKGKVYGAKLTAAEKQAMDIEIRKQIAEFDKQHRIEIEAAVMFVLAEKFGFGKKRLKEFYGSFDSIMKSLINRYEMDISDEGWLCIEKLKNKGIDVERWGNENEHENRGTEPDI